MKIDRIADAAKLPLDLAKRIEQHLEDMGYLTSSTGYTIRFTQMGLESFRENQIKESPFTKNQERKENIKATMKQGGKALGKWILMGIVGIVSLTIPIAAYRENIVRWLKKVFGF